MRCWEGCNVLSLNWIKPNHAHVWCIIQNFSNNLCSRWYDYLSLSRYPGASFGLVTVACFSTTRVNDCLFGKRRRSSRAGPTLRSSSRSHLSWMTTAKSSEDPEIRLFQGNQVSQQTQHRLTVTDKNELTSVRMNGGRHERVYTWRKLGLR